MAKRYVSPEVPIVPVTDPTTTAQASRDAGGQPGQPAVAPRAGQQRADRQGTGQVESRPYQNPRNSNHDVQHERDHDPHVLLAQAPRRTPQK